MCIINNNELQSFWPQFRSSQCNNEILINLNIEHYITFWYNIKALYRIEDMSQL